MEKLNDLETIILKKKQGSDKGYNQFISILANSDTKDQILAKCLKALKNCITLLDKDHEELVGVVLKIKWSLKDVKVVEAYQSFIFNLISVHTDYLRACLRMAIIELYPDISTPSGTKADEEDENHQRNQQKFTHVHQLLKGIVKIVPMSSTQILPLLGDLYPYVKKGVYIQQCYQSNLFQITYYIPTLRQPLLQLIVNKMIQIDVQAPRREIMETMAKDESDESGVFSMDDDTHGHIYADTLDVLMDGLFKYLHNTCYSKEELDWEATKKLYRELLLVFEKVILPTYACAHVQFIMFYLASIKPELCDGFLDYLWKLFQNPNHQSVYRQSAELCDGFLDYLWKLFQNPNHQSVYRQSAVSYMGSLLARGNFVSINTVTKALDLMAKWAHHYVQTCQDGIMADVTHHGPFYSVCQSVFYVFAFRQKEIFDMKKGLKWAESLQFQHLVQSRLNPLKVCLPIVVKTFASITRQHQLAFCDHIIQQNNRSFLPVVSNGTQKMLETFFPFDPYLLNQSSEYIEPHYREYVKPVDVDTASDISDDEMLSDDELELVSNVKTEPMSGSLIEKTALDLMSYGTSPGFKH